MAALYDRFGTRVQTVALQIVGDVDEAEDVVEDTFWQAWRTAGRYDGRRGSVLTWLLITARSRAIDVLRARRRRADWAASSVTIAALADRRSAHPRPDDYAMHRNNADAIESALRELPRDQRQVIEMAFLEGLTHGQIAEQTALPLGTIKTRIRMAMQKLGARLSLLREERA